MNHSHRLLLWLVFILFVGVGFLAATYAIPRYVPQVGKFYAAETISCGQANYCDAGIPAEDTCSSTGGVAPCCEKRQQSEGSLFDPPGYCWICESGGGYPSGNTYACNGQAAPGG